MLQCYSELVQCTAVLQCYSELVQCTSVLQCHSELVLQVLLVLLVQCYRQADKHVMLQTGQLWYRQAQPCRNRTILVFNCIWEGRDVHREMIE